jgi:hypothetical protein
MCSFFALPAPSRVGGNIASLRLVFKGAILREIKFANLRNFPRFLKF